MIAPIHNASVERANDASSHQLRLSVEDMIVLVGLEAMQFQQGKIRSQYQHIANQQAFMKNLQKALNAAAQTKTGRLDKIVFDYTDPVTGKTQKMDLKTFMERFGIDTPKTEYHGIVKFIKAVIDGIGKLMGKAVEFIKKNYPDLVDTLNGIGQSINKVVDSIANILKAIDKHIGEFMKTDVGKALAMTTAFVGAGAAALLALGAFLPAELSILAVMGIGIGLMAIAKSADIKLEDFDLYKLFKGAVGEAVDFGEKLWVFLKENLQEILENWTESLDESQWQAVENNLKFSSDSANSMAQQDHLRLSNALNEYNELTQMVSNNLNKMTQMNMNVIGNMR
jgi:hypothetical protein